MKSFLMVGQSNMAGRGEFGDVPEIKNPHCYTLKNGLWEPMREPVNTDAPIFPDLQFGNIVCGVGLAPAFADLFANEYGEDVGLIPCAHGGSYISQWLPGEVLYDNAVFHAKLAMRSSDLAGILWHQGEQDTDNECNATAHKERTGQVLRGLRMELGDVPILVGGIGDFLEKLTRFAPTINKGLEELCSEIPNCAFVSARGLSSKPDGVHFNSVSCREFGKRYFATYKKQWR